MNFVPKFVDSKSRVPRRHSMCQNEAREVSTDGDYLCLKESRKVREKKTKLEDVAEDDSDDGETPVVEKSTLTQAGQQIKLYQDKLFDEIAKGTTNRVKEVIDNAGLSLLQSTISSGEYCNMNVLHYALYHKRFDIAKVLIKKAGAYLASQTFSMPGSTRSALHQITELGNIELAKLLLFAKSGEEQKRLIKEETLVDVVGQRSRNLSCYHQAAFNGNTDLVRLYLDTGIDVNLLNDKKDTALIWAARWGHTETVSLLLDRNADANIENDKKSTAIHWAVRYQKADTVKLLLGKGKVNPNQMRSMGLVAPLILSAAIGNNKIAELLLSHGADVNLVIRGGECAIHHAAKEGHLKVVKTLLKNGAQVNVQDEKGDTAVTLAAQKNHSVMVDFLLRNRANMFHKNDLGEDCWEIAMHLEENSVLKVLAKHYLLSKKMGAKSLGVPPICLAARYGQCKKIKLLIQSQVDLYEEDFDGNSCMQYAAMHDQNEVILEFGEMFDINKQNTKGNTPLHIACTMGHEKAASALMKMKAKSNIKNSLGETALHVTGYSPKTTPILARNVLEHTIKTHDWVSVNSTDDAGNNALHLAGKFAHPDVLWEFRFVRFKDTDVDGNTPLHEAVRPGSPEALHIVLDIYENMQRDANINQPNNRQETVLHLAASAGFSDCVSRLVFFGADLACKDALGNTVLHRLIKAMVEDTDRQNMYMNVIETVFFESVRWSCNITDEPYPSENKAHFQQIQRKAILSLVNDFKNNEMVSALGYAFQLGCDVFLKRMLTMPEVMSFSRDGNVYFDVTHMTPTTNGTSKRCCGEARIAHSVSHVELLVTVDSANRASRVLDITPFKMIETMYTSIIAWSYTILMALHIAYMTVFTYLGIQISAKFRNMSEEDFIEPSDPLLISAYVIVPLEPVIFLLNGFFVLLVSLSRRKMSTSESYIILAVNISLACLVIGWLVLVGAKDAHQDYLLSLSLCIGWLYSITYTRGFKQINFFWRTLLNMLIRDVFRFMIIYLFVLLAFTFAFHAVFQISKDIVDIYPQVGDSMFVTFTTMVGMSEIFDDAFDDAMAQVGRSTIFPKLLYIVYIVFSTVVLLNLLIAMMNDSYSNIRQMRENTWRVDSIKIGLGIESVFRSFPACFKKVRLQKCKVTPGWDNSVGERWYLVVSEDEIKLLCDTDPENLGREKNQLKDEIQDDLRQMETRIQKIEHMMTENNENVAKIISLLDKKSKKSNTKSKLTS